ncbi:MAG TPA: hypothetical protein VEO53_05715 [Candidatus Binatia bacterium]|nr:hypothetical protein [Candidatus Binatia bacterium]
MKNLIQQKQTEKTENSPLPPFAPVQFLTTKIMKTTRTQILLAAWARGIYPASTSE